MNSCAITALSHSFLGFERTNKTRDPDRFLISFADVEAISKVELKEGKIACIAV